MDPMPLLRRFSPIFQKLSIGIIREFGRALPNPGRNFKLHIHISSLQIIVG